MPLRNCFFPIRMLGEGSRDETPKSSKNGGNPNAAEGLLIRDEGACVRGGKPAQRN